MNFLRWENWEMVEAGFFILFGMIIGALLMIAVYVVWRMRGKKE